MIKSSYSRTHYDALPGSVNDRKEQNLFTPYDSLIRVFMNQRLRQVAKQMKLDIVVPDEFVVPFENTNSDFSKSSFIISKKINVLSPEESAKFLYNKRIDEQLEIANSLCNFIIKSGYADASFDNIRFTKDGKLAIVDTEPLGLIVDQNDPDRKKGYSIEKCARIGLYNLRESEFLYGLTTFSEEVNYFYQRSFNVYSLKKIALSVCCPIIPISILFLSVISRIKIERQVRRWLEIYVKFILQHIKDQPSIQFQKALNQYEVQVKSIKEKYFSMIDGIFSGTSC